MFMEHHPDTSHMLHLDTQLIQGTVATQLAALTSHLQADTILILCIFLHRLPITQQAQPIMCNLTFHLPTTDKEVAALLMTMKTKKISKKVARSLKLRKNDKSDFTHTH
jgi:hypothetical protein